MVYLNKRIFKLIEDDYMVMNASLEKGAVCRVYSRKSNMQIFIENGEIYKYQSPRDSVAKLNEMMLVINLNRKWQRDIVELTLLENL